MISQRLWRSSTSNSIQKLKVCYIFVTPSWCVLTLIQLSLLTDKRHYHTSQFRRDVVTRWAHLEHKIALIYYTICLYFLLCFLLYVDVRACNINLIIFSFQLQHPKAFNRYGLNGAWVFMEKPLVPGYSTDNCNQFGLTTWKAHTQFSQHHLHWLTVSTFSSSIYIHHFFMFKRSDSSMKFRVFVHKHF